MTPSGHYRQWCRERRCNAVLDQVLAMEVLNEDDPRLGPRLGRPVGIPRGLLTRPRPTAHRVLSPRRAKTALEQACWSAGVA